MEGVTIESDILFGIMLAFRVCCSGTSDTGMAVHFSVTNRTVHLYMSLMYGGTNGNSNISFKFSDLTVNLKGKCCLTEEYCCPN